MIHINYTLTQKDYKKYYIQTMTLGYMKIYVVVLALAMIITKLLGMALASEGLQSTATSLFVTFIPTLFLCLGLSVMVSSFDLKKALKNLTGSVEYPGLFTPFYIFRLHSGHFGKCFTSQIKRGQ